MVRVAFWASVGWTVALGLSLLGAGGAIVFSQSPPQESSMHAPDVTKLGPQVGDKVPDFELADQHGQTRSLASLMGPKGLVLVFNRSADW